MTLTELSIKRPTFIVVIFSVLTVLGIFSYNQLKYELLPRISPPFVMVATIYPGASPKEVETSVSKIIEDAVSSVDKINAVRTTSSEGVSFIGIEFQQSANVDLALQDVQRKVAEVTFKLPVDVKAPTITKFALDEIPVLRVGVTSTMPSKEFYQLLKDHIQPRISKLSGIGQVTLIGGREREIKINLDAQRVRSYGLSILQITNVIKMSNLDFPTGKIKEGAEQFVVRIAGKINSLDELRNLVLAKSKQGGDIKLSDVAEIQDGEKELITASRINGKSSVGIFVQKQSDANTVEVSKIVREELKNIESAYASINLKFDVAQDGSQFTTEAADAVKYDLTLAIFFVAIVMLSFLHSIRNSVIVMVAIPASLVSTFIVMYALNYTLNIMTLLAMSLVIGILVDDSIVVLENIYRHIEMGKEKREASLVGRNEIGFSALSITLVDVVVFLPLALVSGLIGNIIRQFSVVVVVSTLLSLFVSFTITPMLASRFVKLEHFTKRTLMGRFALWFESMYHKLSANYITVLKWSLRSRGKVALLTTVMFLASFSLLPLGFIGSEFITQSDRGEFAVTIELPPGSTIENTNHVTQQVENILS
ncbi:MAG: efflux RND transporter permease subunit, partial [Ignavibacteriales bacterium]|nr:efflux RND transporter permease subunit [Ignavibacteriales bacterium]